MPWFALIARDRPDGLEHRKLHRPAHLEHMARLDAAGRLRYGGPLLSEDGEMKGSLIVLEADDLDAARQAYAEDPYIVHAVFESYDIVETRPIFPRGN